MTTLYYLRPYQILCAMASLAVAIVLFYLGFGIVASFITGTTLASIFHLQRQNMRADMLVHKDSGVAIFAVPTRFDHRKNNYEWYSRYKKYVGHPVPGKESYGDVSFVAPGDTILAAEIVVDDVPMTVALDEVPSTIMSMIGPPVVGMKVDIEVRFIDTAKN